MLAAVYGEARLALVLDLPSNSLRLLLVGMMTG